MNINKQNGQMPMKLWQKLCFAVGGVPFQMTSTAVSFFLNIFLLEVAQLRPGYVAIVLFVGKAWDAVTDPLCGFLVQRTRTRFGQFRPWILFSAPFACTAYFLLFYVPGGYHEIAGEDIKAGTNWSMEYKLAYYFIFFCIFEGLVTCLHVPYTSMTMSVTNLQHERDSITAYRMCMEACGVFVSVLILGMLVSDTRCDGKVMVNATQSVHGMLRQGKSYQHASLIQIVIYISLCLITFFGSKEIYVRHDWKDNSPSYFRRIKLVFTYGPYLNASLAFLFMSLGVTIVQGNLALYITHSLQMGDKFSLFIFIILVVSIVCMPVWHHIACRFGKKTTWACGMIILLHAIIGQYFLPEKNLALGVLLVTVAGIGISVALLLPWSVLPDVLDLFMLETGIRQDALFYAFYVFFNKMAVGLALAFSQIALGYGGYRVDMCQQPAVVSHTLRLLVAPAPTVCILLALFFLWRYPIDEKIRKRIKEDVFRFIERTEANKCDDVREGCIFVKDGSTGTIQDLLLIER